MDRKNLSYGIIISYDNVMRFYLDNMMRDRVIVSIPSFFQQLLRICKKDNSLKDISNSYGKEKLIQVTKENILNNIPSSLANLFVQEKYFCIQNYGK